MTPIDLDKLQTKILAEMAWRRIGPHLSDMVDYVGLVEENPRSRDNAEFLFNLLRNAGRVAMTGADVTRSLLAGGLSVETLKALFSRDLSPGRDAPAAVDFETLEVDLAEYAEAWEAFDSRLLPRADLAPGVEKAWEETRRSLKDRGMELILCALDVRAALLGRGSLLGDVETSPGWQDAWKRFEANAKEFLGKLCLPENAPLFYFLSDDIHRVTADYTAMPEGELHDFIREITANRKSYARENHYRRVFSVKEAREAHQEATEKRGDLSPTRKVYLYECALGEKTIRGFLYRTCAALRDEDPAFDAPWVVTATAENERAPDIPLLRAGEKGYGVYMLPPGVASGWGIPMDRVGPLLADANRDFSGALFCSLKEYPNGAALVRFDNYLERERFEKLVRGRPGNSMNIVRLAVDEVYENDRREAFLLEAAMHAAGVVEDQIEFKEEIDYLLRRRVAMGQIMSIITVVGTHRMSEWFRLKHIPRRQGRVTGGPRSNIIHVPETFDKEKWEKSYTFLPFIPLDKKYNELIELRRTIGKAAYSYIAFFMDAEKKVIEQSERPVQFMSVMDVALRVPAETDSVLIVLGPRDIIDAVHGGDGAAPGKEEDRFLYWLIFSPEEEHSEEI